MDKRVSFEDTQNFGNNNNVAKDYQNYNIQKSEIDSVYWYSSFPSLVETLGDLPRPNDMREEFKNNGGKKQQKGYSQNRENEPKRKWTFTEMRKKNESRWMKIEGLVKEKMEKYDAYCNELKAYNDAKRVEINKTRERLLDKLLHDVETKKEEVKRNSAHARIWQHHELMKQRENDKIQRKIQNNLRYIIKADRMEGEDTTSDGLTDVDSQFGS